MSKENPPNYRKAECCGTCAFWESRRYDSMLFHDGYDWEYICQKFNCEISDTSICDSFEKRDEL